MRILFLLTILLIPGISAKGKGVPVQAFWACDHRQLVQGDSCTITLVLLSPYDFDEVQMKNMPRIKGGKIRRLPTTPYVSRVLQTSTRDKNRTILLNRLVYASFRTTAEVAGSLQVKPLKIQVILGAHESLRDIFGKVRGKKIKKRVTVRKWRLQVIPKPQKSTTELMHNRGFL